jgi:hypothetical protein
MKKIQITEQQLIELLEKNKTLVSAEWDTFEIEVI